jgi:hypothetical protein
MSSASRHANSMLKLMLFRFLIGGAVVSAFSALGDVLKPKSFAGLFGAAPSVALATLALTIATDGPSYAANETRSMIAGALAMFVYASAVLWVMFKYKPPALLVSTSLIAAWLVTSFGIWFIVLR